MSKSESNFSFLNFANPELSGLAVLAERYLVNDPNTSLVKLRQFAEKLAQELSTRLEIFSTPQEEQSNLLKRLKDSKKIDRRIINLFHEIRINGNQAIHQHRNDYDVALQQLKNAHQLAIWYYKLYHNSYFTPEAFILREIKENYMPPKTYQEVEENIELVTVTLNNIATLIGTTQTTPFLLNSGESITPGIGMIKESEILNLRAESIKQGIFNLIVIGEFKNGKSTLLNAMLGDKKLPARTNPATAIITMLVYGDKPEVAIYKVNSRKPEIISLEEFKQEYQLTAEDQETLRNQNFIDRFKDIQFAQIQCQNALCKSGVRLIDSPGLAEQISRTKLSTNFLKQSQAVIVVLNATQPLAQEERNFIETNFKGKNNNNLFFVVNRINQVDEDETDEVKGYFKIFLQDLFLDSQNQTDRELFNKRLFFVDAKAALESRLAVPFNLQLLKKSGLLELERELEEFLTSSQRFKAVVSSTLDYLNIILNELKRKIEQNKQALGEPLEELEKRRLQVEERLHAIATKENQIKNIINTYSQTIAEKLCLSLDNYLHMMSNKWSKDSLDFINCEEFNFGEILTSTINEYKRDELTAKIEKGLKEYLQYQLNKWGEAIPIIIRKEVDELKEIIETSLADFSQEIISIESFFANKKGQIISTGNNSLSAITSGSMMAELSHLPGTIMMDVNWFSFFGTRILQLFFINMFMNLLAGPIPWIIFVITQVLTVGKDLDRKNKMIEKIGEKLFEELFKNRVEFQWQIRENIYQQFQNLANNIGDNIKTQVQEVRAEQERIISQKREQSFSIAAEKLRLDRIIEEVSTFLQGLHTIIQ